MPLVYHTSYVAQCRPLKRMASQGNTQVQRARPRRASSFSNFFSPLRAAHRFLLPSLPRCPSLPSPQYLIYLHVVQVFVSQLHAMDGGTMYDLPYDQVAAARTCGECGGQATWN